jgi:o-succinylbenzoate synthase
MKITKIETKILKAPLKTPFQTALRRVESLEDIVVVIYTDTEHIGYGEGSPTPVITGETMGTMVAVIEYITPYLIDRDIEEFEYLVGAIDSLILKNTTAKSALEIALYDLKAKSQNLPLYQMLGGVQREFETDITISLGGVEKMVADSQKALSLGYSILKIKVGESISKDIERIEAIYGSIPKDITLRVDANQGWSAKESVEILTTLESKGIRPQLLEQPTKADDKKALKYIKERIETPILADESIFTTDDARYLLDTNSIDLINIKLAKCGGITHALELADIADEYGVESMMGCMLEGAISVGASLHVASAKANSITMLDLDAVGLCQSNPTRGGVEFEESKIRLSNSIGLGVEY